jgi:hypothetical protein
MDTQTNLRTLQALLQRGKNTPSTKHKSVVYKP